MSESPTPAFVVGEVVQTTYGAESGWVGRVGTEFFGVYFDYESDESGAYSLLVGVGADSDEDAPDGASSVGLDQGRRVAFPAAGPMPAGIVEAWGRVWSASTSGELSRAFTTDIEVHRPDGSAEILIAAS
ncbi:MULTISPECIES: GyrI-like domain-containing protein [unclassified Microbacterium]|uniref:GyrI-like domain-containing protein n=1 Tax=unclassified Microbacterium TaxID=2609290 RepID=UPI000EA85F67|nr:MULTISPECIES: GyrI-like domain-containing protein [unclassified Microbacterium]MBT2486419.1 GyrI-like domain-containing protein [Microbacterium sp. ISL-108]RKN69121.1 AraC family transcriptional regulator [Microbacterium sp. CGR2]